MLVGTNEMITMRRLRMTPTKGAKEGEGERGIMSLLITTFLALVMWYLPVIDHLKRMFSNPRNVELLLWHVNCKTDGKIQHPTDGR
jgi:hypothetical protein